MDRCCPYSILRGTQVSARTAWPAPAEVLARLAAHPGARLAFMVVLALVVAAAFLAVSAVAFLAVLSIWSV